MPSEQRGLKRAIGGIYSFAADKIYDPVIVKGAFKLFGGALADHVVEQGQRAVEVSAGRPILDMPVGTAYFTLQVARRHSDIVVGADIAEGMVREAKRAASQAGTSDLAVVRADAHHLPFEDESFGAILCSNGLQVIPGLQRAVDELVRVLALGGTLFVSIVSVPLGGILPADVRRRVPTFFRPRSDLATVLAEAGLIKVEMSLERLAALYEAQKPPGAGQVAVAQR
jgi:SAM-dependent methyltransferase